VEASQGGGSMGLVPVYAIDKPLGLTSHDVVARARKVLGTRRVGHAGTLDPLATGVLLVLSEEATKLSPWLTGSDKHYLAWVALGADTPTWDAEGPIERTADASHLTRSDVEAALPPFLALREQVPPRHSAIKVDGERAYRAAHRGEDAPALPARPAGYRSVTLLALGARHDLPKAFGSTAQGWRPTEGGRSFTLPPALTDLPTALFAVQVAAGTYLRAFARDLGEALGVPAHLAGLVRTQAGGVDLEASVPLDALAEAEGVHARDALDLPHVTLDAAQVQRIRMGQRLPVDALPSPTGEGEAMLLDEAGKLVAIAHLAPSGMRLRRVWPEMGG